MRILAIDYGSRRLGLAISDPLGIFAQALDTLDARDRDCALAQIKRLCQQHQVSTIVVGLPLRTDGKKSEAADKARAFADEVARRTSLPIEFQDERLTTVQAHNTMKELKADGRQRREAVDRVAATLILQTYLDRQKAAQRRALPEEWG